MYCVQCERRIVFIGIAQGAAAPKDVDEIRRSAEKDGYLVGFNPPPFPPYSCPSCGSELERVDRTA